MSLRLGNLTPRSRRMLQIANACLALGLLLQLFVHPAGEIVRNTVHALVGALLGFSLVLNLFLLRQSRRCRETRIGI
jgi:hypothetical protein